MKLVILNLVAMTVNFAAFAFAISRIANLLGAQVAGNLVVIVLATIGIVSGIAAFIGIYAANQFSKTR